jgi:hypothetical protein
MELTQNEQIIFFDNIEHHNNKAVRFEIPCSITCEGDAINGVVFFSNLDHRQPENSVTPCNTKVYYIDLGVDFSIPR